MDATNDYELNRSNKVILDKFCVGSVEILESIIIELFAIENSRLENIIFPVENSLGSRNMLKNAPSPKSLTKSGRHYSHKHKQ